MKKGEKVSLKCGMTCRLVDLGLECLWVLGTVRDRDGSFRDRNVARVFLRGSTTWSTGRDDLL